jgi:hypothetical protein
VEEAILTYEERTGKGGYHRVYFPKMNRKEFSDHVVSSINEKLKNVFPQSEVIPAKINA